MARHPVLHLATVAALSLLLVACPQTDGPPGGSDPPVADAGEDRTVTVGTEVSLDASASTAPDGGSLDFSWTLTTPDGSAASLTSEEGATTSFTPNVAGTYEATVTVSNDAGSSDDTVVVTAEDEGPPPEASEPESYGDGEVREASIMLPGESEPTTVRYEVIDGLAIYQGDIVLGRADELGTSSISVSSDDPLWPDATVPYEIDDDLSAARTTRAEDAIEHWEDNTPLSFPERDGESDYVEFTSGSGCSSSVGRQGGRQRIRIAAGCSTGNTIHEIGHAVGLWHEQSRGDRSAHVEILLENVRDGKKHNFDQHASDGMDIGPYDHGSVMHYPSKAFAKKDDDGNRLTTIRTKPPGIAIGQRSGLSDADLVAIERLYPRQETPYVRIEAPEDDTFDEGEDVPFRARIIADPEVDIADDYLLNFRYEQWNGVPFIFAPDEHDEEVTRSFCDGTYEVRAEADNLETGATVTDTTTIEVQNADPPPPACAPSIDIVEPDEGDVFASDQTITFRAEIDDDKPETSEPIHPVIWREGGPQGTIIQQPDLLEFSRSKWRSGTTTVHVEYGTAEDEVSFEVVATQNDPPEASISTPSDGETFRYSEQTHGELYVEVDVAGSGTDPEDGPLSGSSLSWSYREVGGGSGWTDAMTGSSGTIEFDLGDVSPYEEVELRLTATDSEGLSDSEIVTIHVYGVQG